MHFRIFVPTLIAYYYVYIRIALELQLLNLSLLYYVLSHYISLSKLLSTVLSVWAVNGFISAHN